MLCWSFRLLKSQSSCCSRLFNFTLVDPRLSINSHSLDFFQVSSYPQTHSHQMTKIVSSAIQILPDSAERNLGWGILGLWPALVQGIFATPLLVVTNSEKFWQTGQKSLNEFWLVLYISRRSPWKVMRLFTTWSLPTWWSFELKSYWHLANWCSYIWTDCWQTPILEWKL